MDRLLLTNVTSGEWPVELVDGPGLWETKGVQTLIFLPPFLGPSATLLIHRLAYTYPTTWTTEELSEQLGLPNRRLLNSLDRAADFDIIHIGSLGIQIPTRLGPFGPRYLNKMPSRLQDLHNQMLEANNP